MRRRAGTLVALSLAVAFAGCGGSAETSAQQPLLPSPVASDLAERSEAIADALEAGDQCGAAHLADDLKQAVEAAVAEGQVPAELQGELQATAVELQNGINCVQEEEPEEEEGEGKGKAKGKDKDEEKGETVTVDIDGDED